MDTSLLVLSGIRAASALCATVLAITAYRAYRRTQSQALLWLSMASALLVAGFLGAGLLYQTTADLTQASVLEAPFTLAALLLIVASLFAREHRSVAPRAHDAPP